MRTTKVNTRFMEGNKTDEVFDLLCEYYDTSDVCNDKIDWCEAIFSNGFMLAINSNMIPVLGSEEISIPGRFGNQEFHHVIFEEECYKIYFKEID